MTGRNPRDRSRQHIVEHQRRDAKLRKGTAQGLLYDAVHTPSRKHRTTLDIHRSNSVGEDNDAENQPWSGFTHRLFRESSSVEGRRTKIVEHDSGCAPEGNKGEHYRRRHNKAYAVGLRWSESWFGKAHYLENATCSDHRTNAPENTASTPACVSEKFIVQVKAPHRLAHLFSITPVAGRALP